MRAAAVLLGILSLSLVSLSGAASAGSSPWKIVPKCPKRYRITFKNTTGKPVNAIAIGDDAKTKDPVKTATVAGWTCRPNLSQGAFYCFGNKAVAPGATLGFSLTLASTLASGVGWQACSSPDNLVTNDCSDVSTTGEPAYPDLIAVDDRLETALKAEKEALSQLESGSDEAAAGSIARGKGWVERALKGVPFKHDDPEGDLANAGKQLHDAIDDDDRAAADIASHDRSAALKRLREAIAAKKKAASDLMDYKHPAGR